MTAEEKARGRELATTESAFRTANDRMRRLAESHRFETNQGVPFLCECADSGCREIVMLSIEDYERLRAQPCWFLLVAGQKTQRRHTSGSSTRKTATRSWRGSVLRAGGSPTRPTRPLPTLASPGRTRAAKSAPCVAGGPRRVSQSGRRPIAPARKM